MPTPTPQDSHDDTQVADHLQRVTRSTCVRFLWRILLPLLIVTFLGMALFGYASQQEKRNHTDLNVRVLSSGLVNVLDDLLWNFQTDELTSALAIIDSEPSILGARIFDSKDNLLAEYGHPPTDSDIVATTVTTPILRTRDDGTDDAIGRLVTFYNYDYLNQRFFSHFLEKITLLLIVIALLIITAYYAYQLVIGRPLRVLLQAIRAADTGDTPTQADWQGNDEISEVIHAHNRMIRHLADKETALADSEKKYRQLFDNAQVGIFHIRPDGTLKDANMTIAGIMGYDSVEAMQQHNNSKHYVDINDRTRLWDTLASEGFVSNYRMEFKRADDTKIWVEISGRLATDGTFNGILEDVTTHILATRALEERDELHRAFFEENKAVMILHDPLNSSIQFVNPAACLYYGYTEDELTSMTVRDLDCMTDDELFEELKSAATERRGYFRQLHTLKNGSKRNVEVFTGPVSIGHRQLHYSIVHDVTEKRRLEAKLERMATRDQLTGAFNRHAFFEKGRDEIIRANRFEHPLAVLMFDLDNFKRVNDTHGHAIGDEVLRVFALRCRADLRQTDIFARLGGEEFAALLVETNEDRAMEVAERIREIAATQSIGTEAGELTITTSIGVASLQNEETLVQLLQRADKGLYEAKESGRNKVCKT